MNLRWNSALHRFEAEFSPDFNGDLAAVRTAGFKCTGPPEWVWYTVTTIPLSKLREVRPASGLTINSDAKTEYNKLVEIDKRNEEVKKQLAEHKKTLKKTLDKERRAAAHHEVSIPEKGYISREDLPPLVPIELKHVPSPLPEIKCIICGDPVFAYEYADGAPPCCFWCQKIVLDNSKEVC